MQTPHRKPRFPALAALAATAVLLCAPGCATPDAAYAWPATVVAIDQLRSVDGSMHVLIPRKHSESRAGGTVVLRVHVDETGSVRRASVFQGSGNMTLDDAALRAIRSTRFVPYRQDGSAVAVTAMAPMHFPPVAAHQN